MGRPSAGRAWLGGAAPGAGARVLGPCRRCVRGLLLQAAALLQLLLCLSAFFACPSMAFCPSGCSCDDDSLAIKCADSQLDVLPIFFNPQVRHIDLHGNRISNIYLTLGFYDELTSLDLSSNMISSLGRRNFDAQESLRVLNVSQNEVKELEPGVFHGLQLLEVLDISWNSLGKLADHVFSPLLNLQELYLSYNRLHYVSENTFAHLQALHLLALDHNHLLQVPVLMDTPSLHGLDLSTNAITTIEGSPFRGLKDLHTLSLAENSLWSLNASSTEGLESLHLLDLRENELGEVPTDALSKLVSLQEVDLSANRFSELGPHALHNLFRLEWLRLSRVPNLTRVHPRALVDNTALRGLHLEDNPSLQVLPVELLEGKPFLRVLALRRNQLRSLRRSQVPVEGLEMLRLGGNPVTCNCSVSWLWELASAANSTMSMDEVTCEAPPALKGHLLAQLSPDQLECRRPLPTVGLVMGAAAAILFSLSSLLAVRWGWRYYKEKSPSSTPTPTPAPVPTHKEMLMLCRDGALRPVANGNGNHHHILGPVTQVPSAFV